MAMAYPTKDKRNKEIVKLRKKGWSFRKIAGHFNIDVKTAHRAYKREVLALVDK